MEKPCITLQPYEAMNDAVENVIVAQEWTITGNTGIRWQRERMDKDESKG